MSKNASAAVNCKYRRLAFRDCARRRVCVLDPHHEPAAMMQASYVGTTLPDGAGKPAEHHVVEAFASHRAGIWRYVRAIVRNRAQAEDITQEAFLRYLQELQQGRPVHNAKAWLFRAAHNLALNQLRDDSRLSQLEDASMDDYCGSAAVYTAALRERAFAQFVAALKQLSPREQRCIALRAEGFRYREIADTLGIRISSVSNYVKRGLEKLSGHTGSDDAM